MRVENPAVRELARSGDTDAMRQLVDAAQADALGDEDLAELARVLATSGAQLPGDRRAADVASTGGPSSLSTLLCPLRLRSWGLRVPTLGVPGRPAGGVDVLQTIPGFRAALEPNEAKRALRRFGCVHLLADEHWAPLDARLFAYRQHHGAQEVPALVIASILAKKIAAGAVGAGLEVRVAPHGNFGAEREEARRNANRYNAVGRLLGLRPVCALTDGARPYQPYIGRGESLIALDDVLAGRADGWLAAHDRLCQRIAAAVAEAVGLDDGLHSGRSLALREAHDMLLQAHGVRQSAFELRVAEIREASRMVIRADRPGVVGYDLRRLRELLVARQRADRASGDAGPPDPAGVMLGAPAGTRLEEGEILMSIRVRGGEGRLAGRLASCARIDPTGEASSSCASTLEVI
jgi:thymidine phosphorylase